jgi:hypothetical protein
MDRTKVLSLRMVFVGLAIGVLASSVIAETLYVDSQSGSDSNPGSKEKPLLTIGKAADIVNIAKESGPTTIKINPGAYCLDEVIIIENDRQYTAEKRFTIEAAILPDDSNWTPASMPVVLSTSKGVMYNDEEHTVGFKIEVNHATIRGIKFLGNPKPRTWHYSVYRQGKKLKDLLVTQCMFIGDKHAIPYNCCICANGHGLVLDHNIFYNCEIPVVFWNAEEGVSKANAMKYCIVDGADVSGVWVCQTDEDFGFHHNVFSRTKYAWMRSPKNKKTYKMHDCVISEYEHYSGYGTAAGIDGKAGKEISYDETNIKKSGKVELVKLKLSGNQLSSDLPRNYLHVKPGTLGSKLGAGLFKKKK